MREDGSQPAKRYNPKKLVDNSSLFANKLVETITFLDNLSLKDSIEKEQFFRNLPRVMESLAKAPVERKILPQICEALEFGSAPALAVSPMLHAARNLSDDVFAAKVTPSIVKLFASTDKQLRVALLENLGKFSRHLSDKCVDDTVYERVATGFTDEDAFLRELTLKSALVLAPKLSQSKHQSLLKHLSKLQVDEEPAIRANTTILLGNVADYLAEATAKKVNMACAEQLKPCIIEAGGSDPMIVSSEAPIDVAVAGATTAAFHLSGQICTSTERFYVHDAVHDQFVEGLADMARKLRVGNGMEVSEIGPLVTEAARDKVVRLVDGAVADGATLVCGGRVPPGRNTGWFYEPTVLTDVTPDMDIMREELFGPVAAIAPFDTEEEALARANDTEYGLASTVWTTNLTRAHRVAQQMEAGINWVNCWFLRDLRTPFGGMGLSGFGREGGQHALNFYSEQKNICIKL